MLIMVCSFLSKIRSVWKIYGFLDSTTICHTETLAEVSNLESKSLFWILSIHHIYQKITEYFLYSTHTIHILSFKYKVQKESF